jgi:hypothetical protein
MIREVIDNIKFTEVELQRILDFVIKVAELITKASLLGLSNYDYDPQYFYDASQCLLLR